MRGTVVAFDEHVGLGTIRSDDGRELPFHCTVLLDGSRSISVGAAVAFRIAAGLPGRWEAVDVSPETERRSPQKSSDSL